MRQWIDLCESKTQYYLRFGEIPENERSGIGASPNWIHAMHRTSDEEEGVSCYFTHWESKLKQWVLDDVGNYATLGELIESASQGYRKIYIITGDLQDEPGSDGEPLLRNVKIVKQVPSVEYLMAYGFYDGREADQQLQFSTPELKIIYPDGSTHIENNAKITASEIDELLGPYASNNGIEGDGEIAFRSSRGGDPNPAGTDYIRKVILSKPDRNVSGMTLTGNVLILKSPTSEYVYL